MNSNLVSRGPSVIDTSFQASFSPQCCLQNTGGPVICCPTPGFLFTHVSKQLDFGKE